MRQTREVATNNGQTYFVTSTTAERRPHFRREAWADLFVETLYEYRPAKFLLHGFVIMPDHFHVLITPAESFEKSVQFMKGGFSFRAKKYLGSNAEVWTVGFSDHRIRDFEDFQIHERDIAKNAVEDRNCAKAEEHRYCSFNKLYEVDACPQGLKPEILGGPYGAAKAAPFQSNN